MHKLAPELLRHVSEKHAAAPHAEKRSVLQKYAALYNISVATLYRKVSELHRSPTVRTRRSDYLKPRVADQAVFEKDMQVIAGIMRAPSREGDGEFLAAKTALELAISENLISQPYTVHTVTRWLARMGMNRRGFQVEKKAVKLTAEHANHVWLVDATVSRLYYLSTTGKVVENSSIARDRSHADDRIKRLGLKKIWLYVIVDLYSKAWWCRGFADEHLGENAGDYFEFFRECFLPKKGVPMHGVPRVLYSDPGSSLKGKMIGRMCDYLGIQLIHHMPHRPRAKGPVEARIHAIQRQGEALLALLSPAERPADINSYNSFMQDFARKHNAKSGAWIKWHQNTIGLTTVTENDIINSVAEPFTRLIDVYGCISVNGQKYEVVDSHELIGQKVDVWRRLNGSLVVQSIDGRLFAVKETGPVEVTADGTDYHGFRKTKGEENRELAILEGKKFRRGLLREDVTAEKQQVLHMPASGTPLQKQSAVPLDEYQDSESAWLFICEHTGYARAEFSEETRSKIDNFFEILLTMTPPVIRGEDLIRISKSLKNEIVKEQKKHG